MLVLSRKVNQSIVIGDDVNIIVVAIDRDTVKLGIQAPRAVPVHRAEVYEVIRRAAGQTAAPAPAVAPPAAATAYAGVDRRKAN